MVYRNTGISSLVILPSHLVTRVYAQCVGPGVQVTSLFQLFPVNMTKEVSLCSSHSQYLFTTLMSLFVFLFLFSIPFSPFRMLIWQSSRVPAQQQILMHLFQWYFRTILLYNPSCTVYKCSCIILHSPNSDVFLKECFLSCMQLEVKLRQKI